MFSKYIKFRFKAFQIVECSIISLVLDEAAIYVVITVTTGPLNAQYTNITIVFMRIVHNRTVLQILLLLVLRQYTIYLSISSVFGLSLKHKQAQWIQKFKRTKLWLLLISANSLLLMCALIQQGKDFKEKSFSMHHSPTASHSNQIIFLQILLLGMKVKILFLIQSFELLARTSVYLQACRGEY